MLLDRELVMSDAQAITGDANSTDVIDLLVAHDIARGAPIRARAQVGVTLDSAGEAATLNAKLVESASPSLSSPTTLLETGSLAEAVLVAGYVLFDAVIPRTTKRYLGVIYDNGTEVFTSGTVDAFLVLDTETPQDARIVGNTGL